MFQQPLSGELQTPYLFMAQVFVKPLHQPEKTWHIATFVGRQVTGPEPKLLQHVIILNFDTSASYIYDCRPIICKHDHDFEKRGIMTQNNRQTILHTCWFRTRTVPIASFAWISDDELIYGTAMSPLDNSLGNINERHIVTFDGHQVTIRKAKSCHRAVLNLVRNITRPLSFVYWYQGIRPK